MNKIKNYTLFLVLFYSCEIVLSQSKDSTKVLLRYTEMIYHVPFKLLSTTSYIYYTFEQINDKLYETVSSELSDTPLILVNKDEIANVESENVLYPFTDSIINYPTKKNFENKTHTICLLYQKKDHSLKCTRLEPYKGLDLSFGKVYAYKKYTRNYQLRKSRDILNLKIESILKDTFEQSSIEYYFLDSIKIFIPIFEDLKASSNIRYKNIGQYEHRIPKDFYIELIKREGYWKE